MLSWTDELNAAWPEKWTPVALSDPGDIELEHDAGGVTLRVRAAHFRWKWSLSADENHFQGSTEGYRREGFADTPRAAVDVLKSALREYAARLMDLAQ